MNVSNAGLLQRSTGERLTERVVNALTSVAHRTAVIAADINAGAGTVTCTKQAGGSATAGVYTVFVVARNIYGATVAKQGNATVTTETTNLTIRAAFATVTTATSYDIYCSTDGAAAKWVGQITEAQRASGILITAVGVTGAGGTAGAVDIQVPGTGAAVNAGHLAQPTAYTIPTPVDCTGYQYVDFDVKMLVSGPAAAPTLKVIPFFLNSRTGTYFAGDPVTFTFGGATTVFQPLQQRIRVTAQGCSGVSLVVASISGTGAAIDVDATVYLCCIFVVTLKG